MTPFAVLAWMVAIGLPSARLTRLGVEDVIFERPRDWLLDHTTGKLETLLACPWCFSAYATAAAVGGATAATSVPLPFLVWLGAWQVACSTYWWTAKVSGDA